MRRQGGTRLAAEPWSGVEAAAPRYRSVSDDPALLLRPLDGPLPSGLVVLRYRAEGDYPFRPQLFVDRGSGFSESLSTRLSRHGSGRVEHLVELPPDTVALRLDPGDHPGAFLLHGLRADPLPQLGATLALYRLCRRQAAHGRALADSGRNDDEPSRVVVAPAADAAATAAPGPTPRRHVGRALALLRAGGLPLLRDTLADMALRRPYDPYRAWAARHDTLSDADRRAMARALPLLSYQPTISVLVPVYQTPAAWLVAAIESVRRQSYPHWQLCLADDASSAPHVRPILERYAASDPRIAVAFRESNGHISAASNSALDLAAGEFVALLDHDDTLAEHALFSVVTALNEAPDVDLLFSDEDKIDEWGRRYAPWFKPDWNPDLMRANNQVVHLAVYRRTAVEAAGRFRIGYEGSQDYDLSLRVAERAGSARIRHIPQILYHWRAIAGSVAQDSDQKPYAHDAARRAIADHVARSGEAARLEAAYDYATHRVRHAAPAEWPAVTAIVPTRDRLALVRRAVRGLLDETDYPSVSAIIVDNGSVEPETCAWLDEIARDPRVTVLPHPGPFNFSAMNNRAAEAARTPLLLLLNNDIEVVDPGWLKEMVAHAVRPGVGAVGCRLLYPNGTIQHAGIVVGMSGSAGPVFNGWPGAQPGYCGRVLLTQNYSAVTAACLLVRREAWHAAGGMDETAFAVAFNDVDFCLKLRARGYRNVYTPDAWLVHHESASLGRPEDGPRGAQFATEKAALAARWGDIQAADPAYNPNLRIDGGAFDLAEPPRVSRPWWRLLGLTDPCRPGGPWQ